MSFIPQPYKTTLKDNSVCRRYEAALFAQQVGEIGDDECKLVENEFRQALYNDLASVSGLSPAVIKNYRTKANISHGATIYYSRRLDPEQIQFCNSVDRETGKHHRHCFQGKMGFPTWGEPGANGDACAFAYDDTHHEIYRTSSDMRYFQGKGDETTLCDHRHASLQSADECAAARYDADGGRVISVPFLNGKPVGGGAIFAKKPR